MSHLEMLLQRFSEGEPGLDIVLLQSLATEMLVVPVASFASSGTGGETRRVSVVTVVEDGKRRVPVFTSEDRFFEWAGEKYQCFSVAGADLGITLPKSTFLLINPNTDSSVELSPEHVSALARIADGEEIDRESLPTLGTSHKLPEIEELSAAVPSQAQIQNEIHDTPDAVEADEEKEADEVAEEEEFSPGFAVEELLDELRETLERYQAVQEAYFVPGENVHPEDGRHAPLVGLLIEEIDAEERFRIIGDIAEISRRRFGEAGAIEVFDDLNSKSSASWDLFYTQVPFFVREVPPVDAPLAEQITYDVEKLKDKNLMPFGMPAEAEQDSESKIENLKKRFFEGLSKITSR